MISTRSLLWTTVRWEGEFAAKLYLLAALLGAIVTFASAKLDIPFVTVLAPSAVPPAPEPWDVAPWPRREPGPREIKNLIAQGLPDTPAARLSAPPATMPAGPRDAVPDPQSTRQGELSGLLLAEELFAARLRVSVRDEQRLVELLKTADRRALDAPEFSRILDQMIASVRAQQDEMRPDGTLAKTISILEAEARRLLEQHRSQGDILIVARLEQLLVQTEGVRQELAKAYSDTFRIVRKLESRKIIIQRLQSAHVLSDISEQLENLINEFAGMVETRRLLAERLRPPNGLQRLP